MANQLRRCDCTCAAQVDPCTSCGGCVLTIPPPIGGTPYADLTEATAAIADRTASCLAFAEGSGTLTGFTASVATNTISIAASGNPSNTINPTLKAWFAVVMSAAGDIEYNFSLGVGTPITGIIELYDNTGTMVDSDSVAAPPGTVSAPSAGTYIVMLSLTSDQIFGSDDFTMSAEASVSATYCGIRAAYGGTPDYLVCT